MRLTGPRKNIFCFLQVSALTAILATAPGSASGGPEAGFCRPLAGLISSVNSCADNRKFAEAAEACRKKVLARADALSATAAAAFQAGAEKNADSGARELFDSQKGNLGEMRAALSSLIADTREALQEVEGYDGQLVWPVEATPEMLQAGDLEAILSRKGACYGNSHRLLRSIAGSLAQKAAQMNSLLTSAAAQEKTTESRGRGLASAIRTPGAGGRGRGDGQRNGPNDSRVTGRSAPPGPGSAGAPGNGEATSQEIQGTAKAEISGAAREPGAGEGAMGLAGSAFTSDLSARGRKAKPGEAAPEAGDSAAQGQGTGGNADWPRHTAAETVLRDLLHSGPSGQGREHPESAEGRPASTSAAAPTPTGEGSQAGNAATDPLSIFAIVHRKLVEQQQKNRL